MKPSLEIFAARFYWSDDLKSSDQLPPRQTTWSRRTNKLLQRALFLLFLVFCAYTHAQDCTPARYTTLLREAKQAADKGQYDLAINKLQSAKTCRPEKEAEVNQKIVAVFEKVNSERRGVISDEGGGDISQLQQTTPTPAPRCHLLVPRSTCPA